MLFFPWLGKIGESEQGCGDEQAYANHHQAAEILLNLVFEAETHDADWNHGYDDVEHIVLLLVERAYSVRAWHDGLTRFEKSFENPCHLFPQNDQRAHDGGHMHGNGEGEDFVWVFHSQEVSGECQMSAAAHG